MKYIFAILFLFVGSAVMAQDTSGYQRMNAKGYRMKRARIDSLFLLPSDTVVNKLGLAQIGNTLYTGNGTKWSAVTGGGGGSDTAFVSITQVNDTTALWCDEAGVCDTLILRAYGSGRLDGGVITQISDTTFEVTASTFRIGGKIFTTPYSVVEIENAGDTARIDRFVADTAGAVLVLQGTESVTPAPPSFDATRQVDLGFVYVGDTVGVYLPTQENYWNASGTDIIANNVGNVRTLQAFRAAGGFNANPATSTTFNGIRQRTGGSNANTFDIITGNSRIGTFSLGTSAYPSLLTMEKVFQTSGYGDYSGLKINATVDMSNPADNFYQIDLRPSYEVGNNTGRIAAINYEPSVGSLETNEHYFLRATDGKVDIRGGVSHYIEASESSNTQYIEMAPGAERIVLNNVTGSGTSSLELEGANAIITGSKTRIKAQKDSAVMLTDSLTYGKYSTFQIYKDSARLRTFNNITGIGSDILFPKNTSGFRRDTLATLRNLRSGQPIKEFIGLVNFDSSVVTISYTIKSTFNEAIIFLWNGIGYNAFSGSAEFNLQKTTMHIDHIINDATDDNFSAFIKWSTSDNENIYFLTSPMTDPTSYGAINGTSMVTIQVYE